MHAVKEDVFNEKGEMELVRGAVISDDEARERGLLDITGEKAAGKAVEPAKTAPKTGEKAAGDS